MPSWWRRQGPNCSFTRPICPCCKGRGSCRRLRPEDVPFPGAHPYPERRRAPSPGKPGLRSHPCSRPFSGRDLPSRRGTSLFRGRPVRRLHRANRPAGRRLRHPDPRDPTAPSDPPRGHGGPSRARPRHHHRPGKGGQPVRGRINDRGTFRTNRTYGSHWSLKIPLGLLGPVTWEQPC